MTTATTNQPTLRREMGLLALTATGIYSMIGAAINVIPFMLALKHTNPDIARNITVLPSRWLQIPLAALGLFALGGFLAVHISKDLAAPVSHWALRSTLVWVIVMGVASLIYFVEVRKLRRQGFDLDAHFKAMPAE